MGLVGSVEGRCMSLLHVRKSFQKGHGFCLTQQALQQQDLLQEKSKQNLKNKMQNFVCIFRQQHSKTAKEKMKEIVHSGLRCSVAADD